MTSSDNIIYRAGVDYESRPMVVICACNLPDPAVVDYDTILRIVLAQLEQFVENDYTVVMFSGGALYRPGWKWLFTAYRSLNRNHKKNLKALYIVHPSTWPRLILGTMNSIISPKFGAKVHYIDTLSQLATVVPLNQINIPAAVYKHNLKFEDTITLPEDQQDHANRVFGAPLDRLMGPNGELGLPPFIRDCIQNLIENGLYVEGLFRRSPSSAMLKQVRAAYDRGNPVDLSEYDIHISAVLLKLFLRELPEPLFPMSVFERMKRKKDEEHNRSNKTNEDDSGEKSITVIEFIKTEIISQLSQNSLILAMEVFKLLRMVADRHESNKMTPFNLAVVMTPNIVRHQDVMQEIEMSAVSGQDKDSLLLNGSALLTLGTVVRIMIENYEAIF
ncbi:Rho GTPase activation protein [Lobosporangium transversale]|uniref:Rho GTPase activation protein n=1 Tax=Lobosporangium transversale TaxID=64571 RepID=A0A1Y2G7I9_9FUNG|nr:Rho GTPase activation protein [Lobosporangium transversale]ORY97094.1 Rho GTPase activation protein [Lobosporangium transversale]|eukprot:XP_021875627.1 Rho GTPase activation protein [Lobosporangium transversale]